jgi:creatinine amidohydrolase
MCAQVYHVEQMSTEGIRALDRAKTAVILSGGILEEHGPYLPCFTDGYMSARLTAELAGAIAARPGWKVLVFPQIPLGAEGLNHLGGRASFSGTYAVRSSTLRAIFMDMASELGEQGFRWIFVAHIHGAGLHNRAIDQAGDYFRDVYKGQMVHLWGLVPVLGAWGQVLQTLSDDIRREEGASLHGGMDETSLMLYLEPRLVSPAYKKAPVHTAATTEASVEVAHRPDWPGYLGSPRLGARALGERIWRALSAALIEHALKILDGADPRDFRRWGDLLTTLPAYVAVDREALENEKLREQKQNDWLKNKKLE